MSSISIPENLPQILKNYVKAAIRSQPEDIISWSAKYFKTSDDQSDMHENISTYVQDRTLFRILAFQLGTTVGTKERIEEVWSDLSLDFNLLEQIYEIGKFDAEHVDMVKLLGITFGHWTKSLKETILVCCEAFCKCLATDGYFLHVDVICKLYEFLSRLDCSLPAGIDNDSGNHCYHADIDNNQNDGSGKTSVVKASKSLDMNSAQTSPLSKNKLISGSASLESIFVRPLVPIGCNNIELINNSENSHRITTGYHVPGIGPYVPKAQMQKVIDYFQKCATDNGGYVYELDIENDQCPQLDAINN